MNAPATPATLYNPGRVTLGAGSLAGLADVARSFGARRLLIVASRSVVRAGLIDAALGGLAAAGIAHTLIDHVPPEPVVQDVEAVLATAQAANGAGAAFDLVAGIGGGSVIDVAKIVAVLLAHAVSLRDLLAKRAEIPARGLPTVMVPTTAGTGAEATPNSIILVAEDELKVGIVSPLLLPDAVILDPLLTLTLPPAVTASTGMDALTHAIECHGSKKGNAFSDLYGLEAIRLISRSLRRAMRDGADIAARADLLLGSYYGGVCIATSSTTAVHALAYPLGGKYRIAHGLSNAILLPSVMAYNRVGNEPRFAAMARAMGLPVEGLSDGAAADAFIAELVALNADLGIPSDLRGCGVTEADLDGLVDGAAKVTRLLDNNPRPMDRAAMREIYRALL
jgi:alcohol dehydrogenase class IV